MNQVIAPVKNLLVIDSQVSDWQSLAAGVGTDTAVLILDSGSDGLTQISDYLTTLAASTPGFTPLQSLQIISHGSAGSLLLGSSTLTTDNLKQYTSQLASIGSSLTATGDILLYGCNVAAGQSGLDFINLFSTLTSADVAASINVTGSAAFGGGNWQLEASTGSIEATAVLSNPTLNSYAVTLAAAIVPGVSVTPGLTLEEGGATGSFLFTLDSAATAGGLTINYMLAGTATLNTDYSVTAGTNVTAVTGGSFTIAAGQTTATLAIKAVNDGIYDPNETINFTLAGGTGYVVRNTTSFDPKVDFDTGIDPRSVSVGDFNGDGKTDLAVANGSSVSVLLRNAANTGFDPKVDYYVSIGVIVSVSVGDFNGDGKADLAVANLGIGTVSVVLRNAANNGFDPKVDFAAGSTIPSSVSVGDFNGDGKTDLAVALELSNKVSVLLRNATNTGFDPKVDFATGSNPASVSVGDFNGDGKLDLAAANQDSNTLSVLLRNATNAGFDPKVDFATGSNPASVSVGDFNGDGKLDLAAANFSSDTVSVLLRNAANTGFDPTVDVATGSKPNSISVGDFNGDGKTDLAVANEGSNTVSVLLRNAANTGFDPKVDFATGSYPVSVSVGDFNGDGKADLAIANLISSTVSVLLNNSAATASLTILPPDTTEPTVTLFTPTDNATAVAVGTNIALTFSESIQKGTGLIQLHSGSATGNVIESFDAASSNRLALSGNTLTIDLTNNLANSSHYFVTFDSGSVKDLAGNNYAGISSYDFTTIAATSSASTISDILSVGMSPDNSELLIKFNSGELIVAPSSQGGAVTLGNTTYSTADITQHTAPQAVYTSLGNNQKSYVLPDLFTGPASLNLKYQLIDASVNAVIVGSTDNDFIKLGGSGNKAVSGGGGNNVIDGGTGSTFISGGGTTSNSNTFFLDGRANGTTWSTIADFHFNQDHATIWGWLAGVSKIDTLFTDANTGGASGYTGLTLHFDNLLPDGSSNSTRNPNLNSITLSGHTLAEFGASSLADLNTQIANGTNSHFLVGQTHDTYGDHGYLWIN